MADDNRQGHCGRRKGPRKRATNQEPRLLRTEEKMDIETRQIMIDYLRSQKTVPYKAKYPEHFSSNDKRSLRQKCEHYFYRNGELYRLPKRRHLDLESGARTKKLKTKAQLVIVDDIEKQNILRTIHSGGGHIGQARTQEKLAKRYWWPGFSYDVRTFVAACEHCQNATKAKKRPPLPAEFQPPISLKITFGYHWCVDIIGPVHKTQRGNEYILVATEYLTKMAIAKPLPSKEAPLVARCIFEDAICMFGMMQILQTDQESKFNDLILENLTELLDANHAISSSCKQRMTDRFNQTLVTNITALTDERRSDWDLELPSVLYAYRTSKQDSTNFTPYELTFGREAPVLIDSDDGSTMEGVPFEENDEEAVQNRMDALSRVSNTREKALANVRQSQVMERHRCYLEPDRSPFKVGDKVLRLNTGKIRKMGAQPTPMYFPSAPERYYEITQFLSNGCCLLIDPFTGKEFKKAVKEANLKKFTTVSSQGTKVSQPTQSESSDDDSEDEDRVSSDSDESMSHADHSYFSLSANRKSNARLAHGVSGSQPRAFVLPVYYDQAILR